MIHTSSTYNTTAVSFSFIMQRRQEQRTKKQKTTSIIIIIDETHSYLNSFRNVIGSIGPPKFLGVVGVGGGNHLCYRGLRTIKEEEEGDEEEEPTPYHQMFGVTSYGKLHPSTRPSSCLFRSFMIFLIIPSFLWQEM